jgi:hypothetical protein
VLRSRLVALREPCVAYVLAEDDVFGDTYDDLLAADIRAIDRLLLGLGGRPPKNTSPGPGSCCGEIEED